MLKPKLNVDIILQQRLIELIDWSLVFVVLIICESTALNYVFIFYLFPSPFDTAGVVAVKNKVKIVKHTP